jgi:hypothetical protein
MSHDIFVSYRRTDRELVAAVIRRLEAAGASVWYDANIEGGADWREVIVEALSNSDMLVIFFSEACNQSRQLKKELAVADSLELPVVPILIEDTKPKGAYLYELADRNWLQAFPDPVSRIDDIVERLMVLAAKSPGGLGGTAQPPPAPASDLERTAPPDALDAAPPTASAPAPQPDAAPPPRKTSAASITARDYIRRKDAGDLKHAAMNDILPFRWIDLAVIVPLIALWAWVLESNGLNSVDKGLAWKLAVHATLALIAVGLFGALVFPVRYYLRKRPLMHALTRYLISSAILYAVMIAAFFVLQGMGAPYDDPIKLAVLFGAFWALFTLIAFAIYAVLAGQRALARFQRNLKKI